MAFEIVLNELGSRSARELATGVLNGVREVDDFQIYTEDSVDADGNFIFGLIKYAGRFLGGILSWATEKVKDFLSWSLTEVVSAVVQTVQAIWNFNWTASDAELDAAVQSGWVAVVSSAGGALGNAVGWLACGFVPGASIFAFNELLGLYVLKEVGQEAFDELAANVGNLLHLVFQQQARSSFVWYFKQARKFLFPETDFSKLEPWSFALQYEKFIESIENEVLQQFIEEFFEELFEACIEAGYVIANSISNFYIQQKMSPSQLGYDVAYELKFNRNSQPNDAGSRNSRLLFGKSELIIPQAVNAIEENKQLEEISTFHEVLPKNPIQRDKALVRIVFSNYLAEEIEKYGKVGGEITFRTKETIEDLTPSLINIYAQKTKSEFAKPEPFIWNKGKKEIRLADPHNGLSARTYLCENNLEGRKLISAITKAALGVSPDWSKVKFGQNQDEAEAYDETPPMEEVAGRLIEGQVLRPITKVKARYCQIIFGTKERHLLWDLTGKKGWGLYTIEI